MAVLETVADALRLAIMREGYACELFKQLKLVTDHDELKQIFRELENQELEHKRKLEFELIKEGVVCKKVDTKFPFDAVEYLDEIPSLEGMDYKEILLFCISKERTSFQFYALMAGTIENTELQDILLTLAEEEVKHLLLFENSYKQAISNQD